jgi:hypothetical protein
MRKALRVVAAAIIASTGVMVAGEAPASADTPRCVSKSEFKRMHKDMKKERVHRIFDIHGKFGDGGAGGYSRIYRECHPRGGDGCTIVEYRDGPGVRPARVIGKTWNTVCGLTPYSR